MVQGFFLFPPTTPPTPTPTPTLTLVPLCAVKYFVKLFSKLNFPMSLCVKIISTRISCRQGIIKIENIKNKFSEFVKFFSNSCFCRSDDLNSCISTITSVFLGLQKYSSNIIKRLKRTFSSDSNVNDNL